MAASARDIDEFPFGPIAKDLREGRCIPFLGAGASSFPNNGIAKPPTARRLAMELAAEFRYPPYEIVQRGQDSADTKAQERFFRAKLDSENLMVVSSWYEHGPGDRPDLHRVLRRYLANERNPLHPNTLHNLLARVAQQTPMAIITTNYDDLVEQAFIERGAPLDLFVVAVDRSGIEGPPRGTLLFRTSGQEELQPVTGEEQLLALELDRRQIHLRRSVLLKTHGHIDRTRPTDDTFVITEEDYVSFLGRMASGSSVIPSDLVPLMQSRRLLFLGYELRDWNFRVLFDRLNRSHLQRGMSYAVSHEVEPAESAWWASRGVVVYDADLNEFVPRLDAALALAPPSS
jgi:hypothetical protein